MPSAFRPPLYPWLLVPCVAMGPEGRVAIDVLHVLLGVATVWITYRLARRCRLGGWSWLAAALVALDPILLGQSAVVMTETAATFLVALAMLCLARTVESPTPRRAAESGVVLALASLCRPELLIWMVACVPLLLIVVETWPARLKVLGTLATAAVVVLSPWVARNQVQFGRPIVTTTHGGYTLLLGNNPAFYEYLWSGEWGSVWDAKELGPAWAADVERAGPAGELQADRRAYDEAWTNIRAEPGSFVYACLVRIGRLWALAPHQGSRLLRRGVAGWYLVEFVAAGMGLWVICRKKEDLCGVWPWGALLIACLTAVHAFYWSDMRMRAPLVVVIALAATSGISRYRRGGTDNKPGVDADDP
ncbi:MAG: glycosyltransferase family 39 protein [Planctomycetia bacterium]|nr:glycosyltransferase family 39 protein [Planctomycetia bacterium]